MYKDNKREYGRKPADGKAGRDSAGRSKTGRDEAGRSKTGRDSAGRSKTGRDSAGRSKTGRDEAGRSKTGRYEAGRSMTGSDASYDRHETDEKNEAEDRYEAENRYEAEDRYEAEESNSAEDKKENNRTERIEGRNAVLEAFRSGKCVDKLFVQKDSIDGPVHTILREAKKSDTIVSFVTKERLNEMSETGLHQGVIAQAAAYKYAEVEDILKKASDSGEPPFIILLDGIEDPHNLGAIIRTADLAGAHGVIISKRRAVGLTAVAARASAGAIFHVPVARVTNIGNEIEDLKKKGLWFVCADMGGTRMYDLKLTGPIGLVVGSEGEGVSRLVKEKCDFSAAIPMKGSIDSLNASVAAGILMYEIVRQRGI